MSLVEIDDAVAFASYRENGLVSQLGGCGIAPVSMTRLLQPLLDQILDAITTLSSRPERSAVEGPAVLPPC
jgi:hypothetical protein